MTTTDNPAGQSALDTHSGAAGGVQTEPAAATRAPTPRRRPRRPVHTLDDPTLLAFAALVDDLERVRIGTDNRIRSLTRDEVDADGVIRGLGLDENAPEVVALHGLRDTLAGLEKAATRELEKSMKRHPLGDWVAQQKGVGMKQAARLLAAVGDPAVNSATGEYRTVAQLWSFSGLRVADGEAVKHRKGVRSNWSTVAKTRAYLVAASAIKQVDRKAHPKDDDAPIAHTDDCGCAPLRVVYDARKAHTAGTHTDWTDGHRHNDAMRFVSKRLLREMWRAARLIHSVREVTA